MVDAAGTSLSVGTGESSAGSGPEPGTVAAQDDAPASGRMAAPEPGF